jgi:hypothetical protein
MSKLRFVLGVLLFLSLASLVLAQFVAETYVINASVNDVALIDRERVAWNTSVCARGNLPANCTQSQACVALAAPGGAACTPAQARQVDAEIFANSQVGREGYFNRKILVSVKSSLKRKYSQLDSNSQCDNWAAGTPADKDAMCAAAKPPVPATVAAGCNLCEQ